MSRLLFFSPWARYSPHFETDLELMQRHLDAGDEVHFIGCNAELPACDRNPAHFLVRCTVCRGKREAGLSMLSKQVVRIPLFALTDTDRRELTSLRTSFRNIEELKAFRVEEFDIGYAVLSTMVSFVRDPNPLAAGNEACLRNLLIASFAVYRSFQRLLNGGSYDRIYIFNGRFAITRAVLRACQSRGVECVTHERGHSLDHFSLFNNTTTHDLEHIEQAIRTCWESARDAEARNRIGARFYEDRAVGKMQAWYSFTAHQDDTRLPKDFSRDRRNVVVFNSSEDEFAAIGDTWINPLYRSQQEGLQRIVADLAEFEDVHIYLRVHPNLRGIDNQQTQTLAQLDAPNLTIIPAESPVGSYALLRAACAVISFGSTMGIEAVFWGVPSILAGQSLYRGLGGVLTPKTHEELVGLFRGPLHPGPKEPALMYGYYMNTFGTPYRYYKSAGVFDGRFKGRRVRPRLLRIGVAAFLGLARPIELALRHRALKRIRSNLLR